MKMALLNKIRKDIKKSSYYVWFLGAQESKGLRGQEYITPVLRNLIQREKTVEPFKITLQISHKGVKIIQNLNSLNPKPFPNKGDSKPESKPNKNDVIKHFIPHHAVTCVLQEDDVVACILLLYNPVTRCPVHVHAYRCDSVETASLLTQQLSTLIERPENQKKLNEIEGRLRAKGLLLPTVPRVNIPKRLNSSGSEGRSTTSPASESSGGSSGGCQNERITNLYDSLAAELREKLGMGTDSKSLHAPILLPPRDYDTVHRQKGNLAGIEMRRCLNEHIVGIKSRNESQKENGRKLQKGGPLGRILGSSGGSSGIGSDHPPSPEQNGRYLDNQSSSEEEWVEHPSEDSLFLISQEQCNGSNPWRNSSDRMSLPRSKRFGNNREDSPPDLRREESESPNRTDSGFQRSEESLPRKRSSSPRFQKKESGTASKCSISPGEYARKSEEETIEKRSLSPYRNPNHRSSPNLNSMRNSGKDVFGKISCGRQSPIGRKMRKTSNEEEIRQITSSANAEDYGRDKSSIPIENFRKRNEKGNMSPVGIVAPRRRTSEENRSGLEKEFWDDDDSYKRRIPGYKDKIKSLDEDYGKNENYLQKNIINEENRKMSLKEKKLRENTMKLSPQERFLDAKTKFLMLEKERMKEQEKNMHNLEKKRSLQDEAPISPEIIKNRPTWTRSDDSKALKSDKSSLIRRNSFFDLDHQDSITYFDKEPRGKSVDHPREAVIDPEIKVKRLSRSASKNRYFSQERLNESIDYDIRYTSSSPKNYNGNDGLRRTSREEQGYGEGRRFSRSDYSGERGRKRYESPDRERRRYFSSDSRRKSISDEENYHNEEDYRSQSRKQRSYSNGKESPRGKYDRYDDGDDVRGPYEDENDVPISLQRYKSPARRSKLSGREESLEKIVPYEKSKKSKYEIAENEKKISSKVLAKEFKRRSYQEKFEKAEMEKRREYGDRDYDERYREDYADEMGCSEKAEVQRRNQYNLTDLEFKRNSHELAREFNRRSRGYSYDSEDDSRRKRSGTGYQELNDRERYPGLDRETARIPHHPMDDRYPDSRASRLSPDEQHEMYPENPRITQMQMDKMPARYRHSFVYTPSPGLSLGISPGRGHEILHRTNSSVSSNRVGIAAVHPN